MRRETEQKRRRRKKRARDFRAAKNPKQRAFLAEYVRTREIRAAARAAGVGRQSHYLWLRTDAAYRRRFQRAGMMAADEAGAEVRRRAGAPAEDRFGDAFPGVASHRQRAFLVAYLHARTIRGARELSGVGRQSHYLRLEKDAHYRRHFSKARTLAAEAAEEEVLRRALEGGDVPILYLGEITGWRKSYSDALAMFMLKRLRPEVYGDRRGAL